MCLLCKEGERIDDLQRGGLKILQKEHGFRFGTDAVLLSDFALIRRRERVADFGTGTGVIALLIAARHPDVRLDAIELQPDMADMARRSVEMNGLQDRITVHEGDLRDAPQMLGCGRLDAVICNPPYNDPGRSLPPEDENRLISRSSSAVTVDEICQSAFLTLKSGGRLSMVFPAQGMLELMDAMQRARLAPKRVRTVHGTLAHAPRLVLIDAVKQGGSQLHWLPPLILNNPDGTETEEYRRIYF